MNDRIIRRACAALGISEPISIEPDGTIWTGTYEDKVFVDVDAVHAKVIELETEEASKRQSALSKLIELGLTEEEVKLILS